MRSKYRPLLKYFLQEAGWPLNFCLMCFSTHFYLCSLIRKFDCFDFQFLTSNNKYFNAFLFIIFYMYVFSYVSWYFPTKAFVFFLYICAFLINLINLSCSSGMLHFSFFHPNLLAVLYKKNNG